MKVINVIRRTSEACPISEFTIKRYRKERKERSEASSVNPDQEIGLKCGIPKLIVDEFTLACIRRIVHSFYKSREHPTVEKVLARCRKEIQDLPKLGRTSPWRLLKQFGFKYQGTRGDRPIMKHCGKGASLPTRNTTAFGVRSSASIFGRNLGKRPTHCSFEMV